MFKCKKCGYRSITKSPHTCRGDHPESSDTVYDAIEAASSSYDSSDYGSSSDSSSCDSGSSSCGD